MRLKRKAGVFSGCRATSHYNKPGETPSKLAEPAGLGAVSGARRTIIISIMKTSCQETSWSWSSLLNGEERRRANGVRCLHAEPKPASVTDASVTVASVYFSALVIPTPTCLSLLTVFSLSVLSLIYSNPAHSLSFNNYHSPFPAKINPDSSLYSPMFHYGLDGAPLPLHVIHRPVGLASTKPVSQDSQCARWTSSTSSTKELVRKQTSGPQPRPTEPDSLGQGLGSLLCFTGTPRRV